MQAVLAHELGHLKCDHGVWLTFANILTLGAYSVPGRSFAFHFPPVCVICLCIREGGSLHIGYN